MSGYSSSLYDDRLAGWRRLERETFADGARPRTEVLWLNPACVSATEHGPLFANVAIGAMPAASDNRPSRKETT